MVTSEEAEAQKTEVIFSGLFCQLGAKLELNLKSDDHNPTFFLLHHICYHLEHQECVTATTGEQHHHRMKCGTGLIYRPVQPPGRHGGRAQGGQGMGVGEEKGRARRGPSEAE